MAFSGLVSGSFNKLGKMGVIAGFSLGYLLHNFYVNSMGEAIISLPVLAAAFILVLLLPQKLISRMRLYFSSSHNITNLNSLKLEERARDRLYELASVLNDLGRAFKDALIKRRSGYFLQNTSIWSAEGCSLRSALIAGCEEFAGKKN